MKLSNKINRRIKKIISEVINTLRPYILKMNYLGYTLYFSKGTSLINMIDKETSIYEPDTCEILLSLIEGGKKPSFIDIGANIGLISLYMLRNVPDLYIYAFDPGPHQTKLFRKTIDKNKLNNKIKLFEIALNDTNGEVFFCIHNSKDVSGDGFRDTGLAGDYKKITVRAQTLDDWWIENNRPKIDLVKIDTEGAELIVLKGGREFLNACHPNVYFEMHPSLYKTYEYSHLDILYFFDALGYVIYSLDKQIVSNDNIESFLSTYANYYAKPLHS